MEFFTPLPHPGELDICPSVSTDLGKEQDPCIRYCSPCLA